MKSNNLYLFATALTLASLVSCGTSANAGVASEITVVNYYRLGDTSSFNNDDYLVSKSDKENVYFDNGKYIIVRDNTIRQIQYSSVVPYTETILNYLSGFDDFSQQDATIICTSMSGEQTAVDMSTTWENCNFGELIAYWKTSDSKGTMVTLYPGSTAVVSEFLYYSDLAELMEVSDSG